MLFIGSIFQKYTGLTRGKDSFYLDMTVMFTVKNRKIKKIKIELTTDILSICHQFDLTMTVCRPIRLQVCH